MIFNKLGDLRHSMKKALTILALPGFGDMASLPHESLCYDTIFNRDFAMLGVLPSLIEQLATVVHGQSSMLPEHTRLAVLVRESFALCRANVSGHHGH